MSINFPSAPTAGQTYTDGRISWIWDGGKWVAGSHSEVAAAVLPPLLTVTGTTTLPAGYVGFVQVENATAGPLIVFLPATPAARQEIEVKDTLGNAGSFPITVDGVGQMIEGSPTLVIAFNYGWVDLIYTGSQWVQR